MHQYKRVREKEGKKFIYNNIKNVYTIIFFENSPKEFNKFPDRYLHTFKFVSESGLRLEHLQEIYCIPLDIFKENLENESIRTELDMWLTFLSSDDSERILELIEKKPWFGNLYEDIYHICRNTERVMEMYSKELEELDRNTTLYMIDHMKNERLMR